MMSELRKITDAQNGFFALVESDAGGKMNDAIGALLVERLGHTMTLDREHIQHSRAGEAAPRFVRSLTVDVTHESLREIDGALSLQRSRASVLAASVFESTPGKRFLAYANVGGGRLYLLRAGKLHMLAASNTELQEEVQEGKRSAAEAKRLDQSNHPPTEARRLAHRAGLGFVPETKVMALETGDRVILLSERVGNALTEDQIVVLLASKKSAKEMETRLQLAATEAIRHGHGLRAEEGDVAAIVYENRPTLRREVLSKPVQEIPSALRLLQEKHAQAEAELKRLRADIAPRYGLGDVVRNKEGEKRRVVGYDPKEDEYQLEDPSLGEHVSHHRASVGRFALESWQPSAEMPLRGGDRVEDGHIIDGTESPDGTVVVVDTQGKQTRLRALDIRFRLRTRIASGLDALHRLHATARQLKKGG